MKKLFALLVLFTHFNLAAYSQACNPCVKLKIASKAKTINIDSLERHEIEYTITNCSDISLQIDENELLDYESRYSNIYFKIFNCVPRKGCVPYNIEPHDIQRVIEGKDQFLKSGESYTYRFDLFKFYSIEKVGNYRLIGFFQQNLFDDKTGCRGFYLQESNPIDIQIIN